MTLKMKQINDAKAYGCVHISVATIANTFDREFRMISSGDWSVKYSDDVKLNIGSRIDVVNPVEINSVLKPFHGILMHMKDCSGKDDLEQIDSMVEDNVPVLANCDLYHCPWWPQFFQKYHFYHCYIIFGSEYRGNRKAYCGLDPTLNYQEFEVEGEQLLKGLNRYGMVELLQDPHTLNDDMYYEVIRNDMNYLIQNQTNYNNILRLADDIDNNLNLNLEFDDYTDDLYVSPIMDKIRKVYTYRYAYSCLLKYVFQITGNEAVKDGAEEILNCANCWKVIRTKLLKKYILKYQGRKFSDIAEQIRYIAEIEKNITERISFALK